MDLRLGAGDRRVRGLDPSRLVEEGDRPVEQGEGLGPAAGRGQQFGESTLEPGQVERGGEQARFGLVPLAVDLDRLAELPLGPPGPADHPPGEGQGAQEVAELLA